VESIAGGRLWGFADGIGLRAQFNGVYDIAISKNGIVYCADAGNHRVRSLAQNVDNDTWVVTTIAGSGCVGTADGIPAKCALSHPDALCLAPNDENTLYVCCDNGIRIVNLSRGYVSTLDLSASSPRLGLHSDYLVASPDGIHLIYYIVGHGVRIVCVQTGQEVSLDFPRFERLLPMCWDVSGAVGAHNAGLFAIGGRGSTIFKITGFPTSWFKD
jgi:hypothetical protein